MAAKNAVADEQLGKIFRRMTEIGRRVSNNNLDPDWTLEKLQTIVEGPSRERRQEIVEIARKLEQLVTDARRRKFDGRIYLHLVFGFFGKGDPRYQVQVDLTGEGLVEISRYRDDTQEETVVARGRYLEIVERYGIVSDDVQLGIECLSLSKGESILDVGS